MSWGATPTCRFRSLSQRDLGWGVSLVPFAGWGMKYSGRFRAIRCLPRSTLMNISGLGDG